MITEQHDIIKKKYDFTAWKGINRLDRELSVRNISLPKDLIAGLDHARIREIDPGDGSRLLRMSWSVPGHKAALLVMDIRECESRDAAHQVLLELLTNMQAPDIQRLGEDAPGDVAFSRDSATALVFARGNIVLNINNGGEELVQVDEVAKTVDRWIVKQNN